VSGLVALVVPWGLLAVFLFRARRARIFLLGIPFLLFMDQSVFFDGMRLFHTPGRLPQYELLTLWMLVVWVLATGRVTLPGRTGSTPSAALIRQRFLPEELAVVAVGALALGHIAVDAVRTADFGASTGRGLEMLCMVLGYFLIRDVVGHASRREVVSFLATVVAANAVATVLFVLHQGLHLNIYSGAEHAYIVFGGQVITRTFYFAPRFVALTLAFVFARRRWGFGWAIVVLVTVLGVLVSYTRSLLLIVVVALLLVLVARQVKSPSASRLLRSTLGIAAAGVVLLWSFATFMPTQAAYLDQRLSGSGATSSIARDSSVAARTDFLASTLRIVERHDIVFGLGFPSAVQEATVAQVEVWGADMAWILVVYRLGMAGVIVFAVMFVGFAARAFALFMKQSGEGEYLGLLYFVALVTSFLLTAISRTFMEPGVLPMTLWLFAFVAAEARRPKAASVLPAAHAESRAA
jgi:hypothetical protein